MPERGRTAVAEGAGVDARARWVGGGRTRGADDATGWVPGLAETSGVIVLSSALVVEGDVRGAIPEEGGAAAGGAATGVAGRDQANSRIKTTAVVAPTIPSAPRAQEDRPLSPSLKAASSASRSALPFA
jgi:hypothetical protein